MRSRYRWSDVLRAFKGPLIVVEFFFLYIFFYFSCWRQLTQTRQAIHRFTGHLNWPLCNKISGLLSAVPGPFELTFMQQGGIRAAQMQSPVMRLPARQSLQNTFRDGPGAHDEGCDMGKQTKAWAGIEARQKQAKHGMANADQERCSTTGGRRTKLAGLGLVS